MKKTFLFLCFSFLGLVQLAAREVDIDGIRYRIDDERRTAEVIRNPSLGKLENLTILETVVDGGIAYTVTSIGEGAFLCCSSLISVHLPQSLTSIDSYAFYGCRSLASVHFPASLVSIGYGAFYGCTSLSSVRFSQSLKELGEGSFWGCSLKSIKVYSEAPLEIADAFDIANETATLFVPKGAKSAYEHAENWRSFLNIQEMDVAGVSSVSVRGLSKDGEYFNLRGMKVERPSAGVYLWRKGNKTRKVMLR